MEGHLQKWTNYLFGWRERWVVIKGSILYYFINKTEKPRGRLHLGITILNFNDTDTQFEIDTGTTVIYFKTDTIEEKNKWVATLKIAKISAENSIKNIPKTVLMAENNELSSSITDDSVITEDVLIRKINIAVHTSERLKEQQQNFEAFITTNQDLIQSNNELLAIHQQMKNGISSINSQLNDLKMKFVQFNKDFIKVSEFFFNHINRKTDYRGGGFLEQELVDTVNDKDLIAKAKSSQKSFRRLVSIETIQRGDDVFYSVDDDEEEKENLINKEKQKYNNSKDITNDIHIITSNTFINKIYDPLYKEKRTEMPIKKKTLNINVWEILKDAIGKDLNRFCVPVFFNEPISMLQKLCENFQYAYVLNNAAQEQNPYIRLALAASFCIGGFTMNVHRAAKYFNPLLGETYEYVDNDLGYRYFSEQVSHHPAISACYVEGKDWSFYANSNAAMKFLMTGALDINNLGRSYISLSNFNETIAYTKPMITAKNLIFGKITLDIYGKFYVNNNSGDTAEIELIGMSKDIQGVMKGVVKDVYGNTKLSIEGNWLDKIEVIDPKTLNRKVIWTFINGTDEHQYFFPPISFDLNRLSDEMKAVLPPSDSRFRPDQQAMENQDLDKASSEKHRLEENQRKRKKENDKIGLIYKPLYFEETYDDITGELVYKYQGDYWQDRINKNIFKFPNLFN